MLGWPIEPLPDFLTDHTLTGKEASERLKEHAARWVQFLGGLWTWADRADFALRYFSHSGRTEILLLAVARHPEEVARLEGDIEVLLRSHRLIEDRGSKSLPSTPPITGASNPFVQVEVRQLVSTTFWDPPGHLPTTIPTHPRWKAAFAAGSSGGQVLRRELQQPRVVYPWWGPGGPFLLPMEAMVSQPVPVSLTIYLSPTRLTPLERDWLALMSREAMNKGDQNIQQISMGAAQKETDPSARLAGRMYSANLRRLSATPFLVTVHCGAAEGREDVAMSLAGAIQALIHEPPFERPQQEDDRLPSGAEVVRQLDRPESAGMQRLREKQFHTLRIPVNSDEDPLARLQFLVDAQGAATVFRLPVSVRGGVPGIRVRQLAPNFHPGARELECPPGHIELGHYHGSGGAYLPIRDLTKHALITGFTGSGKTVTVLQILHQLWSNGIPFLVLESAKQEYRGLLGVEAFQGALRIYTLGNETCVPFRLNPFELLPGVRVEAHLGKLQTCFEAAIPPIGPSSSVISEALLLAYEECGWNLTDTYPLEGRAHRSFPILRDFVNKVEEVLTRRGYEGEVASNLRAALVGRFQPLLMGSKGKMFEAQSSTPAPHELFRRPVVLEMNDLILEDKALMVMFVLTLLREYREIDKSLDGSLKHVTMVEEAHNVLEDVGSVGGGEGSSTADTRFKAVQAFCGLLTEIRALGEGLIIADQSPMKLARDAMRNTNLQIAHQLRDGHDRDAIANAMIMEEEQRDFLGKLPPGHAALFRTGLEKATFIKVSPYYPLKGDQSGQLAEPVERNGDQWRSWRKQFRGYGYDSSLTDPAVKNYMELQEPSLRELSKPTFPFDACKLCQSQCRYRDQMFALSGTEEGLQFLRQWMLSSPSDGQTDDDFRYRQTLLAAEFSVGTVMSYVEGSLTDATWCYFLHTHSRATKLNGGSATTVLYDAHRAVFEVVVERHPKSIHGN
ncbi:MAG TPA: DUF87 domain-containing protein [Verrucomicrobiota bacterium]|nr:hypothetical protein [Verrucomicrobiales bacterium]HRI13065.1 DUF87 domain-containing protein [Verrucomicrobiota bacterium]